MVQHTAKVEIGAAFGDALLAALGTGFFTDRRQLAESIRIKNTVRPDPEKTAQYAPYKERYTQLYEATKHIMHVIKRRIQYYTFRKY